MLIMFVKSSRRPPFNTKAASGQHSAFAVYCLITSRFTMLTPAAAWPMRSCYFKMGNLSLTHKSCTQLTSVRCSVCRFGGMIVCTVCMCWLERSFENSRRHISLDASVMCRDLFRCALGTIFTRSLLSLFCFIFCFCIPSIYRWCMVGN